MVEPLSIRHISGRLVGEKRSFDGRRMRGSMANAFAHFGWAVSAALVVLGALPDAAPAQETKAAAVSALPIILPPCLARSS